jgi:putative SOS response-associated peptidase YedK
MAWPLSTVANSVSMPVPPPLVSSHRAGCKTVTTGRPFAFAGLWERWLPADGEPVESCTILTAEVNALARPVHNRMPVIIDPADFGSWLDPAEDLKQC